MADEHKLIAERERGHLAKQIIDSPIWDEAWELYIDGIWNSWRNTEPNDTEARERAYVALHVAAQVRKHITNTLTTGKMAEQALESIK